MKRSHILSLVWISSLPLLIGGCVSASNVHKAEIKILSTQPTRTLSDNIHYSDALAEQYMALSDQASGAQDAAALGLISAAGVAAGGMLYDANLNLVKGAGLAAGTLTATSTYFKPGETSVALLDASEQLICIRKAAEPFKQSYENDDDAVGIVSGGILTVRLNLRKKLNRTLPDYRSLVDSLKAALANQPTGQHNIAEVDRAKDLNTLRASVASCVLPSG
jgi:hypothetical protein